MAFTKITNAELNSRGATTLPNQPTISAVALKQEFDAPAKEIVAPHFNGLIDELEADTAGASIGLQAPSRRTGSTVKAVVDAISQDLVAVEGKLNGVTNAGLLDAINLKHEHENKSLLDTYDQTNEDIEDAVNRKHSHSNKSVLDKWSESAGGAPLYNGQVMSGDMYSSDYDPDSTVKNAGGIESYVTTGLGTKVDKADGKGLSTNDFTDTLKTKLDNIESGAEVNVQADYAQNDTTADDYIKNKPTLGTAAAKNAISVVTDSTDLVESGAVENIIGWGNKNLLPPNRYTLRSTGATVGADTFASYNTTVSYIVKIEHNTNYKLSKVGGDRFRVMLSNDFPEAGMACNVMVSDSALSDYEFNSGNYNYVTFYCSNTMESIDTIKPMLRLATITDATYEPYHASVVDTIPQEISDALGWDVGDLFNLTLATLKSINTAGTWNNNKYTYGDIEYTVNDDMTITTSGTASVNSTFYYFRNKTSSNYPSPIVLSGCPSDGSDNSFFQMVQLQGNPYTVLGRDTGNGVTVKIPSDGNNYQCLVRVSNGTTCNKTFTPKLVHISVDEQKADTSVIAPIENGDNASQAYAVNDVFIRNGALCKVTSAISQGDTLSNQFTITNVGAILTALLNA